MKPQNGAESNLSFVTFHPRCVGGRVSWAGARDEREREKEREE